MMRIYKDVDVFDPAPSHLTEYVDYVDIETPLWQECRIYGHDIDFELDPGAPLICKRCGKWID